MKIVLVEDNLDLRLLWEKVFPVLGHELKTYSTAYEAIQNVQELEEVSLIITDYFMPGMTGVEFANIIRHLYPEKIIFFITGADDDEIVYDISKIPQSYLFIKPVELSTLKNKIEELFPSQRKL